MKISKKISIRFLHAALILIASHSVAQDNVGAYKDLRLFVGFNVGSASNEDAKSIQLNAINYTKDLSTELGFQGGVSMTYGNQFYVSPGIWYSNFTANSILIKEDATVGGLANTFENSSKISMLSIPIRLGFRLISPKEELSKVFNMRIFGGITGQHILSVTGGVENEARLSKDDFENVVISANSGFGFDVFFLYADIGYDLGLTNFEKINSKSRHNSLFINIGTKFKF